MDAYTIVKQLILPPGIILVLMAVAFFLVRGTLGRLVLFVAWSLTLLMSLPAVVFPAMGLLESYPALAPDQLDGVRAGAIVVLGAGATSAEEYGQRSPDSNSLARLRYAAWLHRRTGLPIYVSGGGEQAPGAAMARVLRDELGVPVAGVDEDSRDTWENALYSKRMLDEAGVRRVLLVTQAFHMPRAVAALERVGLDVIPAPTGFLSHDAAVAAQSGGGAGSGGTSPTRWLPQAAAFYASFYGVHELLGQLYYRLRAGVENPGPAA